MDDRLAALERRVKLIEDREAIRTLVGRYAMAMDDKDFDLAETLFTEDARFAWADNAVSLEGRAAIMEMYRSRLSQAGPSFHVTHDQFVEWDANDPDRASGLVLGHAETSMASQHVVAIRYRDRYQRVAGRWLFRERVLGFLYNAPVAQYDGILARRERIITPTGARPAHWP